ncbi:hypothetical protein RCL_jg25437.t1 [Rhizophagus clarus]|uniref:Uncharacterized protein n=1 Tax=Rhizophagus clarus TaxID=94130 RepID=A0A8H3QIW7_9GLOM|nr:hypothetical protein RCL_jg25437.t1 [Rhizophagus clarus]
MYFYEYILHSTAKWDETTHHHSLTFIDVGNVCITSIRNVKGTYAQFYNFGASKTRDRKRGKEVDSSSNESDRNVIFGFHWAKFNFPKTKIAGLELLRIR